jgi:ABC-type enterochelin transport system substrate-binding protein
MKKLSLPLLVTLFLVFCNLTLSCALMPERTLSALNQPAAAAAEEAAASYLLRTEDGRVCVYRSGVLVLRTEIDVSLLPAADRAALEDGIIADSSVELATYLEDFGS